jgi:hypothetical protein
MALETRVVMAGPEDLVRFEVDRDTVTFIVSDARLVNGRNEQWRVLITETRAGNTWQLVAPPNTTASLTNQQRNFLRSRDVKVLFSREATVATIGDREANLSIEMIQG